MRHHRKARDDRFAPTTLQNPFREAPTPAELVLAVRRTSGASADQPDTASSQQPHEILIGTALLLETDANH